MRPTTLRKYFKLDMIRVAVYGVIAEKPRVGHLPEIFRALCRKNYTLDRKMIVTFLMVSTSSITAHRLGRSNYARRL